MTPAIRVGHWSEARGIRRLQIFQTALLTAAYAASAVYCTVRAGDAFATRASLGTTPGELAFWLAGAAASLLVLCGLLAALPLPRSLPRRAIAGTALALVAAAVLTGTLAGAAEVGPSDCGAFAFEPANWHDAVRGPDRSWRKSERLVAAIDRCGVLDGKTRAELVSALGRPSWRPASDEWQWSVPSSEFGLSFTSTSLTARFPHAGRRAARVEQQVIRD